MTGQTKKYRTFIWILMAVIVGLSFQGALAQTDTPAALRLRMNKNFGYQQGSSVQGNIGLRADGPEDLAAVEFFIDEKSIGVVSTAPFKIDFVTDTYATGIHPIYAVGTTAAGETVRSNTIEAKFVTAEEGWQAGMQIAVPMLVLVLVITVLAGVMPLLGRKKLQSLPLGAERNYGITGGAICRNCQRPFPLSVFGMNLGLGKLQSCPYCGKFAIQQRASREQLRQAELMELENAKPAEAIREMSEEEKLRKQLDDSRYTEK